MKNRNYILYLVVVLLFMSVGGNIYTYRLNQKREERKEAREKEAAKKAEAAAAHAASPFDNPNTDPMAAKIPQQQKITSIQFEKTKHDFGKMNEGDIPKTTFEFTNTGQEPLLITSAVASCGCTVANWPRGPIAPGESSRIDVAFDSKKKSGEVTKTVTVTCNTIPPKQVLTIRGTVIPKN
ncbi:MAG: DUF1573 domain-containing protein [Bacteroidetes bacterium]|nr:DUF1573 domain-containing protein [Bacteroidota bacterium]